MPARVNGNGDDEASRPTRMGDVAALARVIRKIEPELPSRGPEAVAARRRMVAAFFRMLDERGAYKSSVPSNATPSAASVRAAGLPPRLQQILQLLLTGDGEK
jgi:hypothetical protein